MTVNRTFMPERSEAECLWLWPTVLLRVAPAGQDYDFAHRIMQQSSRPGWSASPMQLDLMRRMVKHYAPEGIRLDPDLIERASTGWAEEEVHACERCNADGATLHMASGRMLCAACISGNRARP